MDTVTEAAMAVAMAEVRKYCCSWLRTGALLPFKVCQSDGKQDPICPSAAVVTPCHRKELPLSLPNNLLINS